MKSLFPPLLLALACPSLALAEFEPVDVAPIHDKVTIRLNQKITFAFDQHGNRLLNPHRVKSPSKGPVITVELTEEKHLGVLTLHSTFPRMVRYHAAARKTGEHVYERINRMYGLVPKVGSVEGFETPIEEFVLYDFTLTDEKLDSDSTNETIGW